MTELTKRELFAAMAMQGMLAGSAGTRPRDPDNLDKNIAKASVILADALLAALDAPSKASLPLGWKLVPVEPTVEMKVAGDNAGWWCADKYRAMLAAAPDLITPWP